MTEKTSDQSPATVTFGLTTNVQRKGWPIHGSFRLQEGDASATSRDMFSVQSCRERIQLCVKDGHLNGDQAANLELEVISASLPVAETRYDKISRTYGREPEYEYLIGHACGALPPEEDSGPARFEACEHGQYCDLDSCEGLPVHARLFSKGIASGFKGIIFSQQGATALLKQTVEDGLLLQEEADGLMPRILGFSTTFEAERADKLCQHLAGEILERELNLAFNFRQRDGQPHFFRCHQYYYLRVDDNISSHTPIENEFDAKIVVNGLTQLGFMSYAEQTKLLYDLAALKLPPGNEEESVFNSKNIARRLDAARHQIDAFFSSILGR